MIRWEDYREEGMPEELLLYRAVMDYPDHPTPCPPEEQCLVGIRGLFKDKPQEYWRQRNALQNAWSDLKKAMELAKVKEAELEILRLREKNAPSEWKGGPCPVCKRLPEAEVEGMTDDELLKLIEGLNDGSD